LRPKYIDIAKMLGELSTLLGRTLGEQHSVQIRPGSLTDELHADPAQLENALMNLAINARDAMPDGGKITISANRREITPGIVCQDGEIAKGEYAVLEVSDEGTGMSPELLTRVFEPFFTTKAPHRGSGLGLSMVYGFARQSGGYVGIESALGHGTTVSLYFPLKAAVPLGTDTVPLKSQWQADGLRVLVVEDQLPVLKAVTRMLQQFGLGGARPAPRVRPAVQ
jgi:signal transduction histidine kinase